MATDYKQEENGVVALRKEREEDDIDLDLDEEEDEEEQQNWEDWNEEDDEVGDDENFYDSEMLCLFCDSLYTCSNLLFQHCASSHHFDFNAIKKILSLDFYGCFKLINYIRFQVSEKTCWCCRITCESKQELQHHLHEVASFENYKLPWDDDKYLTPFMEEDPLLYSFGDDEEGEDDGYVPEKVLRDVGSSEKVSNDDNCAIEQFSSKLKSPLENGEWSSSPESDIKTANLLEKSTVNGFVGAGEGASSHQKVKDRQLSLSSAEVAANEIKDINKNYFGSYSSFGIHREMISDKVRTDAYRRAILENPSLLKGAVVMDVGCGTGILSLFAAQARASRVIAVEASKKMASVAAQVAKDNGLLSSESSGEAKHLCTGKIEVVQAMVEELENAKRIKPESVDVLLSEWMGYCLLYESMLSSVLYARDKWLKPGGAILPDTATIFVAGFGRGGTSLPFWENVYGFNMSCIGKEVVEDAAQLPLVDTIDGCDIVTETQVLQSFDLVTMKHQEMDFTGKVELAPKSDALDDDPAELSSKMGKCHGLVLWFETGFTKRFCREMPTILSTSPNTPKTHWSQTILTFKEPITMGKGKQVGSDGSGAVGSDACPAGRIQSRISIVRGAQHRSIDISMEISAIGPDGRRRSWPVQMFKME
ncbi:probable protein arginine N-methyltransferase 3 [Coffea eugenioides]|uniref:probable protein arginine N-methyltransferase 3 n=1 Tax=Coffea eugenioides TaxID=49369 RepID=UPI000F60F9C2|nr:probable protein arginine N-methyltransferase 3 [Coffea eugenioides]